MLRRSLLSLVVAVLVSCNPVANKHHPAPDETASALSVCAAGTTLAGVDVSDYQGTIDWPTTAGSGIVWAYAKATEGLSFQDTQFTNNWSAMKSAGVTRGAYHFFHPGDDGTAQADYFLAFTGTIGAGDLPPMLDWEVTDSVSGSTAQANAQAFVNEILAKTGKQTVIYTSSSFLSGAGVTQSFASDPLWVADWQYCTQGCCPVMAADWTAWSFWQWSDQGTVPGISPATCVPSTGANCVDLDIFNGDAAALAMFAGGSSSTTCPSGLADGYYCGGSNGVTGLASTLYQCQGGAQSMVETCATWCASTAQGDLCVPPHRRASRADVDGDGQADLCARGVDGVECWLSTGGGFATGLAPDPTFADTAGWNDPRYDNSLVFADVDGDGKADVCSRGPSGFQCWLGNGSGFPTATSTLALTDADSWSAPAYRTTIEMADIDGDGKLDVCARAAANETCWLFDGQGFNTALVSPDMGDTKGWNVVQYYSTIALGDVTGDGKADLCGRGWGGFECWVSTGSAFVLPTTYVSAVSDSNGGDAVSVYSTIRLADVNGDGKLDVCARLSTGFSCWLADGTGAFPTEITGPALSDASGWNKPEYFSSIAMADINGDGQADLCAREALDYACWLSTGSGFSAKITGPTLSDAQGWIKAEYGSTMDLADINGDGKADLCARSSAGIECWLSTGSGFVSTSITGPVLSDAVGWNQPPYFSTIRLVGSPGTSSQHATASTSSSTSGTTSIGGSTGGSASTSSSTTAGSTSASAASAASSSTATSSSGASGSSGSNSSGASTTGGSSGTVGSLGSSGSSGSSTGATTIKSKGCGCGPGDGPSFEWLGVLLVGLGRRRRA